MLIVISIMLMLVALMATVMQPATEARRTREAARMVNVYLSTARNRAMETGRPCGVIFRNFNTNASAAGFAMNADQCEVPPCFAGYTDNSTASVTWSGSGNSVTAVLTDDVPNDIAREGDVVQFNGQGPYYAITNISTSGGNTTLTLTFDSGQIVPWTVNPTTVPYRIFRAPMKGAATPMQLPAGAVVDLYWSGKGNDFIGLDNTLGAADLTILFSPHGSVDYVYYGQNRQPVTEPIFLLIGLRERVGTISDVVSPTADNKSRWMNWQDLETGLWVTVNPNTGVIGTEPMAAGTSTNVATAIVQARSLAREAKGMGGR